LANINEVPDLVVTKCVKFIKKLWHTHTHTYIYIYTHTHTHTHTHNASLESDIFPDWLKITTVEPLHKRKKIQHYRPVSLPLVFSKILETLMKNKLTAFITKNNISTQAQNDFREGKST